MAQADYNIAPSPSGLNLRTEVNTIFSAILSNNSGSTAPTVTSAFMLWVDTSNATYYYLKMRNHDDTAWVTLGTYTVATKTYISYIDGDQTISGIKTFGSFPVTPSSSPTTNYQVANKKYVDDKTVASSETASGIIELATTAETQAGTDNSRAITPLKLKNSVIGLGQTWQNVTASRVGGTTYTNSTGKPIMVCIALNTTYSGSRIFTIDGVQVDSINVASTVNMQMWTRSIVPNNSTYSFNGSFTTWMELR